MWKNQLSARKTTPTLLTIGIWRTEKIVHITCGTYLTSLLRYNTPFCTWYEIYYCEISASVDTFPIVNLSFRISYDQKKVNLNFYIRIKKIWKLEILNLLSIGHKELTDLKFLYRFSICTNQVKVTDAQMGCDVSL